MYNKINTFTYYIKYQKYRKVYIVIYKKYLPYYKKMC